MGENHHESLVEGIAKEQKELLEKSEQGIFIYLDDTHKVCNEKFAAILGYSAAKEWAKTDAPRWLTWLKKTRTPWLLPMRIPWRSWWPAVWRFPSRM